VTLLLFFRKEKQTDLCLQIQYMVKLDDICKKVTNINSDFIGTIDYIDISSIDNKRKSIVSTQKLDFSEAPSRAKQLVLSGDILISNVRPNLNAVAMIINDKNKILVASTGYTVIRCNNNVFNRYVFFFCQYSGFVDLLVSQATGASYPAVNASIIKDTIIPLPTLEKQHQIANTLDKLQSIITHIRTQLEKLDLLVKARFVEMFGDMILNPNKWKKVLLGEVCDVRDGTHDSPKYFVEGYPLITSKNVTGGKIDFTNCSLICEDDYNKINQRSRVDIGDILMPMIGTVGNPVIVDINEKFAIKNVALIKFKDNSKVINTFIKSLLESDYFDRVVINKVRGGTQKFISLGDIRKLNICLPPMELQTQFADFVKQVDQSKSILQQELTHTQTLFDSLMQEYFG